MLAFGWSTAAIVTVVFPADPLPTPLSRSPQRHADR